MSQPAGPRADATGVPLFPLSTVLFPGGPLPLRIFETRYVDMVRRCMREECAFGVVLIRAGSEVGAAGTDDIHAIGTTARIVDFDTLSDGLLGIVCMGEDRFTVGRHWQDPDGLHVGELQRRSPEPAIELPPEFASLGSLLREILPRLGELYQRGPQRFEDASWVSCRWAEILPMALAEKQCCLELDDPVARLARLQPWIARSVR